MSQAPSVPWTLPGAPGGPAGQIGNPYFSPQAGAAGFGGSSIAGLAGAVAGGGAGGLAGGIAGALPWGGGGGNMFYDLAGSYQSAYNSALAMNQANYQNIQKGYQQTMAQQQSAQQAIGAGYGGLYNTIMGGIQGIGQSQAQEIADQYAKASGAEAQQMTNRGLGNTTVGLSVQRGLTYDQQKAQIALANQLAGLQAGYAGQIGGAALNFAQSAAMQNTALAGKQLDWMNSIQAKYPDAAAYNQLYKEQGAIGQANADRAMLQQRLNQLNPYAGGGVQGRAGGFGGYMGTRGQAMTGGSIGGMGPAGMPAAPVQGPGMIRQRGIDPGTGLRGPEAVSPYQSTYGAGAIGGALGYGVTAAEAAQYGMSPEEYIAYHQQGGIIGGGEQWATADEAAAAYYGGEGD